MFPFRDTFVQAVIDKRVFDPERGASLIKVFRTHRSVDRLC